MIVRNGSRGMFSSLNMPGMTSQSAFRHDRHMGPWMIVGKWPIVEDLQSLRRGLNISVSLTNGLPRAYGDTSPSQMNGLDVPLPLASELTGTRKPQDRQENPRADHKVDSRRRIAASKQREP